MSKKKVDDIYQLLTYLNNLNSSEAIHKNLLRFSRNNIKRLRKINCIRGRRHRFKLPTRGQRTHGNGKSSKKRTKAFRLCLSRMHQLGTLCLNQLLIIRENVNRGWELSLWV